MRSIRNVVRTTTATTTRDTKIRVKKTNNKSRRKVLRRDRTNDSDDLGFGRFRIASAPDDDQKAGAICMVASS